MYSAGSWISLRFIQATALDPASSCKPWRLRICCRSFCERYSHLLRLSPLLPMRFYIPERRSKLSNLGENRSFDELLSNILCGGK